MTGMKRISRSATEDTLKIKSDVALKLYVALGVVIGHLLVNFCDDH